MNDLTLWESEYTFMCVIWDNAPVNSGKLVELCKEKAVALVEVETMHELGRACGIHVKAAAAAII